MIELLLNENNRSVRDFIVGRLRNIDTLKCAVAYFADSAIVDICFKKEIKIKLLVALTPPTNPYILQKILPNPTSVIEVKFYTRAFHSKLTIFEKNNKIKYAIIGSSNYTNGKNISGLGMAGSDVLAHSQPGRADGSLLRLLQQRRSRKTESK
ncbi:MAG: NgoFVII family restriction endonuclease, partial [Syntrophaceae bacterium]|nr:NgoFVII family restriction endonuclease [Syntrophaceae bacterium]